MEGYTGEVHILSLSAFINEFNMYKPEMGYNELVFSLVFVLDNYGEVRYFVPDIMTAKRISPEITFLAAYLNQVGNISNNECIIPHSCFDFVLDKLKTLDNIYYKNTANILNISPQKAAPNISVSYPDDEKAFVEIEEGFEIICGRIRNYTIYNNTLFILPDDFPVDFYRQLDGKSQLIGRGALPYELENGYVPGLIAKIRHREKTAKTVKIKPDITINVCKAANNAGILLIPVFKYGEYIQVTATGKYESGEYYTVISGDNKYMIKRDTVAEILLRDKFKTQFPHLSCRDEGYFCSDIDSIKHIWNKFIPSLKKEYDVIIEDSIDCLEFAEEHIKTDIRVSYEKDSGYFSFNIGYHCSHLEISLEELRKLVIKETDWILSGNKFIRIKNTTELENLCSYCENPSDIQTDENGRLTFELPPSEAAVFSRTISGLENASCTSDNLYENFRLALTSDGKFDFAGIENSLLPVLRNYQKDGVRWMSFLDYFGLGGILADDMGLGKTLQVLALLKAGEYNAPALVVCPKTLIFNWYDESHKFTPELKVLVVEGNPDERKSLIQSSMEYDIVITSYSLLQRDIEHYSNLKFALCILDEAQHIKNPLSERAKTVKLVQSRGRFALTGTPMENNILELWSIFDFTMPGLLGSKKSFAEKFNTNADNKLTNTVSLEILKKRIRPFIMRRTKKETLHELPEKIEQVHSAVMSEKQLSLYVSILEAARKKVFDTIEEKGFKSSHIEILSALTKLRQVCNHPGLVDSQYMKEKSVSSKLELFKELILDCMGENRKILVFSQFTKMLGIFSNLLEKMDVRFSYLDGATTNRGAVVKEFNENDDISVFLISIKAGGYGLNLTSADTVIIYDPWWNPMVENQAIDRTHRIGQKNTVNVYRLIARESIEEKILALQKKKQELFNALIDGGDNLSGKLTIEDIKYIFE